MSEAISYVFTWHALSDACPKCQRLNGREYRDQDLFQDVLWDPWEGDIFDLNRGVPLTHPNCRCTVTVEVKINLEEIPEYERFRETMKRL